MPATLWRGLVLCALAAISPLPAAEAPVRLPPWIVEANALRRDAASAPASAIVTPADWFERAGATLADFLGRAPGLLMQESFGGFEPPRLSIRGSGLQSAPSSRGVALLLDGLPLGLADGSFNSAFVESQFAGRIETFRGFDGWRVAPATMGGALDLISPTVTASTSADVRTEGGSFGAARVAASAGAVFSDTAVHGAASFSRQDGYRARSGQERAAFFGSVRRPLLPGGESAISVYHARPQYDVPGPLTLAVAQSAPRSVSADVLRDLPRRDAEVWRVAATTSAKTPVVAFDGGLAWLRTNDFFRQLQANGISNSKSDDLSFRGALTHRFHVAGSDHQLRLATTAARGWRDFRRYANDAGQTGALFGRDGLYATTATLSVEDSVALAKTLTVNFGVATLRARRDIADRLLAGTTPASTTQKLGAAATLPQANVVWAPRPEANVFLGVSQVAEPPTFDDLLVVSGTYPRLSRRSQPLATQRATTCELGTRGAHGPVSWDVTAYRGEWSNEILRLADAKGSPRGAVNAGPTRHLGIETTAQWRIIDGADRLSLRTSAAWTRCYFDHDPVFGRNRLAGVPPHLGSAELLYEPASGFFGAAGLDWTAGQTPVDHAGRMTYGGHALVHLRAGWRQSKTWSCFVDVQNVFDRQHIASTAGVLDLARNPAATAVFLPGVGRSVTVGWAWRR